MRTIQVTLAASCMLVLMCGIALAQSKSKPKPKSKPKAKPIARVSDERILECSGIAVSRANKNAVWMHNDSGDKPRLFLVGLDGRTKLTLNVDKVKAIDWEDVCTFSLDNKNWLLVGDIGDNMRNRSKRRPKVRLYLIEEPVLTARSAKVRTVKPARVISFEYEDGPGDCEGIAVDTAARKVLLLSKRVNPLRCRLYSLPLEPKKSKPIAKAIAQIPMPICTGLDLSPDGLQLLMTSPRVGFLVQRARNESWDDAARRAPKPFQLPGQLRQTEAICWDASAQSIFVTSEGKGQQIWQLYPPSGRESSPDEKE